MTMMCYFVLIGNAQAYDAKVIIVNGTSNHCRPELSCYTPYQVDIAPGDTITWLNEDNRTHTVTTGTTNYGPVGVFDSGIILPGNSFTQFFGSVGKYQYYDKTDMWPSGLIVVSKNTQVHAEIGWVNGSLIISKNNFTLNGFIITKEIQNTGSSDANSILITLKIRNQSGFQFYNNIVTTSIPAKQTVPVKFTWDNPPKGFYQLFFEANSANTIGDTNANNDASNDLISISKDMLNQPGSITQKNFTLNSGTPSIPEFGATSYLILIISITLIMIISNSGLRNLSFS